MPIIKRVRISSISIICTRASSPLPLANVTALYYVLLWLINTERACATAFECQISYERALLNVRRMSLLRRKQDIGTWRAINTVPRHATAVRCLVNVLQKISVTWRCAERAVALVRDSGEMSLKYPTNDIGDGTCDHATLVLRDSSEMSPEYPTNDIGIGTCDHRNVPSHATSVRCLLKSDYFKKYL